MLLLVHHTAYNNGAARSSRTDTAKIYHRMNSKQYRIRQKRGDTKIQKSGPYVVTAKAYKRSQLPKGVVQQNPPSHLH